MEIVSNISVLLIEGFEVTNIRLTRYGYEFDIVLCDWKLN
jgi:hypothetical protein